MSRVRVASAVAVAIAALVVPLAIAPAAPDPAYSVAVATSPKSVPGGGEVQATVTVTTNRPDTYPGLDYLTIGIDWNPAGGLLLRTSAPDAPIGCARFRSASGEVIAPPVRGGGCDVVPSAAVGGTVQFTYSFTTTGTPPALTTVEASTELGWIDAGEGFEGVELAPDDLVEVTDSLELAPVFAASVTVDRQLATSGSGELITATFRVRHEPTAAPRMDESQVQYDLTWPSFLQVRSTTAAADDCDGGLVSSFGGATCFIHEPDSTRKDTTFAIVFEVPAGGVGQGAISMYGMGGWYDQDPIITLAPMSATSPRTSPAALGDPRPIAAPGLKREVPAPPGALPIPSTWTGLDSVSVAVADDPFPMSAELQPDPATVGEDEIEATIRIEHDPDVPITMFDLALDLEFDLDVGMVPIGDPEGCATWIGGTCTVTGLDDPGSSVEIRWRFEPAPDWGSWSLWTDQVAARFDFESAGSLIPVPDGWLTSAYAYTWADAELVRLDVQLPQSVVWEGGPDLSAQVVVTRAPRSWDGEYWGELVVGVAITLPDFLDVAADPPACEAWDGLVCEVRLPEPGVPVVIDVPVRVVGTGTGSGPVDAEGAYLQEFDGEEFEDLPVEWVVPDSETIRLTAASIDLDLTVTPILSWDGGPAMRADVRLEADEELADYLDWYRVGLDVEWPTFLSFTSTSGCSGAPPPDCVVEELRGGASEAVTVSFFFDVVPDGSGTGEVTVDGVELIGVDDQGEELVERPLPVGWVGEDAEPVEAIAPRIDVDLVLDHSPGYTGGKPLVATTTVRHVGPTAVDGLAVELRFDWPGFVTLTADTGCTSFVAATRTCVIEGLDAAGASAVVTLTFSMPPPSPQPMRPPVPEVPPRTGDVVVSGVGLRFLAPSPPVDPVEPVDPDPTWPPDGCEVDASGVCVCDDEFEECPLPPSTPPPDDPDDPDADPDPVVTDLPLAWIGGDREPFTLLQPFLAITPSVANPGDGGIMATARNLPAGSRVSVVWSTGDDAGGILDLADGVTEARWVLFLLRWESSGARHLLLHSEDGLFGDVASANRLMIAPRSATAPDLVGRGG